MYPNFMKKTERSPVGLGNTQGFDRLCPKNFRDTGWGHGVGPVGRNCVVWD